MLMKQNVSNDVTKATCWSFGVFYKFGGKIINNIFLKAFFEREHLHNIHNIQNIHCSVLSILWNINNILYICLQNIWFILLMHIAYIYIYTHNIQYIVYCRKNSLHYLDI